VVHGPGQAHRALAIAAAGLLAAAALGGCGGGSHTATSRPARTQTIPTSRVGGASGNPTLGNPRLVDCRNWRAGADSERYGTIRELRGFAGGPSGGGYAGATLPDKTAYRVLEGWCRQSYATYFKLYKLYTRAAAFRGAARGSG
jgi:hypothetical protein